MKVPSAPAVQRHSWSLPHFPDPIRMLFPRACAGTRKRISRRGRYRICRIDPQDVGREYEAGRHPDQQPVRQGRHSIHPGAQFRIYRSRRRCEKRSATWSRIISDQEHKELTPVRSIPGIRTENMSTCSIRSTSPTRTFRKASDYQVERRHDR